MFFGECEIQDLVYYHLSEIQKSSEEKIRLDEKLGQTCEEYVLQNVRI